MAASCRVKLILTVHPDESITVEFHIIKEQLFPLLRYNAPTSTFACDRRAIYEENPAKRRSISSPPNSGSRSTMLLVQPQSQPQPQVKNRSTEVTREAPRKSTYLQRELQKLREEYEDREFRQRTQSSRALSARRDRHPFSSNTTTTTTSDYFFFHEPSSQTYPDLSIRRPQLSIPHQNRTLSDQVSGICRTPQTLQNFTSNAQLENNNEIRSASREYSINEEYKIQNKTRFITNKFDNSSHLIGNRERKETTEEEERKRKADWMQVLAPTSQKKQNSNFY